MDNNIAAFPLVGADQNFFNQTPLPQQSGMTLLDYFAKEAMSIASSERQETVPASFWDYIKWLCANLLHMHFLKIKYTSIEGVQEQIAQSAYKQAAAMLEERKKYIK